MICVACKKELKYITNLRTSIISRSLSCILNNSEEVSSFKTSLSISKSQKKKYREHCRICFANDIELRSSSYVISYQFEKLTELEVISLLTLIFQIVIFHFFQLAKNDKQCLLCINEFQYLERVRKDLLKSHDVFYKNQVKNNICCYYCTKPFKKEREMVDITDKMKSQFKDFTGIDVSRTEYVNNYHIHLLFKL